MNIHELLILRIKTYLQEMDKDENFKKSNPNLCAQDYLVRKVQPYISQKHILNILNGRVKRITFSEVYYISCALNISMEELFKDL